VPRVDSVIVKLERRDSVRDVDYETFASVVKHAFAQRRKTLRNTLAELAGSASDAERLLGAASIPPSERAENVDTDGYLAISRALAGLVT
jgi:16S rRNA (adenine1518-N6/adenine1519-N6)-dimethyltransferase